MAATLEIVVVEDHDLLREELVMFLRRPGWHVRAVDCGEALDATLRTGPAHVVVLDLNLPFEDGYSIARRLRAAVPAIGIVMLTARTRPSDRTMGYETGADVYLTKPTNVHELEAIIHNLARRLAPPADNGLVLHMGDCTLGSAGGPCVLLTLNEAQLLHDLATAPERQLDNDYLIRRLSQEYTLQTQRHNLTVLISRLRSKIDDGLPQKGIIKAVRGYGYKLTVPIVVE